MADKLGEGYIEIFGLDAKFNASMKQVQAQLASTIQLAKTAQASVSSVGASPAGRVSAMVSAGRAAMGLGGAAVGNGPVVPPTIKGAMGIFGPGMTVSQAQRYSKMPHPTMPGLNALGQPMAGSGAAAAGATTGGVGGGGAAGQIQTVTSLYRDLMGLYAARVVGGVFVDAVKSGGDMIETLQKTRVTFGAATGSVNAMVDDMAAKFGSNKGVMLDAAAQFGLIGQAAHMSEAESAKLATTFTRLADDASSFYNVPLEVALRKIQSGLTGQSRPLRDFGVMLNISVVNARAAEMGFKRLNGNFSEAEKIMARASLITEQLNKAQGDHGRTMDTYANQVRQLAGDFENLKTAIGMPMAAAAAGIMSSARTGAKQEGFFGGARGAVIGAITEAFFPDQAKMDARMGVNSKEMTAAIIKPLETPMEKFQRERAAYDQFMFNKGVARDKATAIEFGPMGMMGGIGQMMNAQAMLSGVGDIRGLDKKIAKAERQEWGGGHVTDTLGFLRQAQESILKPQDETQKEQLAELKAIREAIVRSTPDGKARGAVLRGRES